MPKSPAIESQQELHANINIANSHTWHVKQGHLLINSRSDPHGHTGSQDEPRRRSCAGCEKIRRTAATSLTTTTQSMLRRAWARLFASRICGESASLWEPLNLVIISAIMSQPPAWCSLPFPLFAAGRQDSRPVAGIPLDSSPRLLRFAPPKARPAPRESRKGKENKLKPKIK